MTEQFTGGANWDEGETGPQHRHRTPPVVPPVVPPPVVPPAGTLPVLAANTGIGTGSQATAWAQAILVALGAPSAVGSANVASLVAWFAAEDNNAQTFGQNADGVGQNNPLDITADSGSFAGVTGSQPSGAGPNYPGNLDFDTPAHGVAASAYVIKNGPYNAIYAALASGKGLIGNSAVAANLSTWSGGGYSSLL